MKKAENNCTSQIRSYHKDVRLSLPKCRRSDRYDFRDSEGHKSPQKTVERWRGQRSTPHRMMSRVIKTDLLPVHTGGDTEGRQSFRHQCEKHKFPGNNQHGLSGDKPSSLPERVTSQVDKGKIGDVILETSVRLLILSPVTFSSTGEEDARRQATPIGRLSLVCCQPV